MVDQLFARGTPCWLEMSVPTRSPQTARSMLPSVEVEHQDRHVVFHALRDRGRIHHPQVLLANLVIAELAEYSSACGFFSGSSL